MWKSWKRPILVTLLVVLILAGTASAVLFSTQGSGLVARWVLGSYLRPHALQIGAVTGSLMGGLQLEDLEISDPKGLPDGTSVQVQALEAQLIPWNLLGARIVIRNGRLRLPDSDPILFFGSYQDRAFDVRVSSAVLNIRHVLDLFAEGDLLKDIDGTVSHVDGHVTGSGLAPTLSGTFSLDALSWRRIRITDCPGFFSLRPASLTEVRGMRGEAGCRSGTVTVRQTTVRLEPSTVRFVGRWRNPSLDLHGISTVEGTKIRIALQGTQETPELTLSSSPPMKEERLLLMLATGKAWTGTEASLRQGELSAAVAKDAIDYLIFGGARGELAERFGIVDVTVTHDGQARGLGVTQAVSERLEVGYAVEQPVGQTADSGTTHAVETEYKMTEGTALSLQASQTGSGLSGADPATPGTGAEGQREILLKLKTEF